MEFKVHLKREDSVDKIRHINLVLEAEGSNPGSFEELCGKLIEVFPKLNDKQFTVQGKDENGELTPIASDKQLSDFASDAANAQSNVFTLIVSEEGPDFKKKRKAWRKRVQEAVPKSQRRWARAYIQAWRDEHLETCGGEEGEEKGEEGEAPSGGEADAKAVLLDKEKQGVPEVYKQWLDVTLPRWHRKWGGEVKVADLSGNSADNKPGNDFKEAVPVEFRKWVRFYLGRKFGKRDCPKLKGEPRCKKEKKVPEEAAPVTEAEPDLVKAEAEAVKVEEPSAEVEKKKKKPVKYSILMNKVPKVHRRWAKAYIGQWRVDNLDNASSSEEAAEETNPEGKPKDDTEEAQEMKESQEEAPPGKGDKRAKRLADREKHDIPEVYVLWMDVVLPRWHRKWGGDVPQDSGAGKQKNEHKDSVPHDFRKWSRAYLARRYGKKETPKLLEDKPAT